MSLQDSNYRTESPTGGIVRTTSSRIHVGRVIDVILNSEHKHYDRYGGPDAIGAVLYASLDSPVDTSPTGDTLYEGIAYPLSMNFNTLPVKNEIILVEFGPSTSVELGSALQKSYYQTAYNLWNHPHHGAYPTDIEEEDVNIGDAFEVNDKIAPLQPYPGDTIISGRLGQTIRLSGTRIEENKITDDSNRDKPFTIISNGKVEPTNGFLPVVENINEDPSSIFMTSDHVIPLSLANNKRDSYDKAPELPTKYQGSQVLVNSDRVVLNARKNDLLISGQESVGINSNTVNIDGKEFMCIDADKIYIGSRARIADGNAKQPIMLGHQVERYLHDVLDVMEMMAKAMMKAKTVKQDAIPNLIYAGSNAKGTIKSLKSRINPKGRSELKSKKTFVE